MKVDTRIVYTRGETNIIFEDGRLNTGNVLVPELSIEKIAFIPDKRSIIADYIEHKIEIISGDYYLQEVIDNFMLTKQAVRKLELAYLGVTFKVEIAGNETRYRFYSIEDNSCVRMSSGSSGMHTVTPICVIAEYFANYFDPVKSFSESLWKYLSEVDNLSAFNSGMDVGDISSKNVHLMVEEPELNLDPYSQLQLVDQLVGICFGGTSDSNMSLAFSIQSLYILNYLNLLIKRHTYNAEGCKLSADKISAYELISGTSMDLMTEARDGQTIVNAVSMSEPLSEIYAEYNRLSNSK